MSTTSAYGWNIPDNTDLVKDGALAIRTLGNAIDTSMNTALGTKKAGIVLLNTTTFSAVSSQSISDVFSTTYDNYRILLYSTPTSNIGYGFNLRVSGADNTTANYRYGSHYVDGASGAGVRYSQVNATKADLCQAFADPVCISLDIYNPFNSSLKTTWTGSYFMHRTASTFFETGYTGGSFNATTSFTGFTISGGTQTGTISVYGYSK